MPQVRCLVIISGQNKSNSFSPDLKKFFFSPSSCSYNFHVFNIVDVDQFVFMHKKPRSMSEKQDHLAVLRCLFQLCGKSHYLPSHFSGHINIIKVKYKGRKIIYVWHKLRLKEDIEPFEL